MAVAAAVLGAAQLVYGMLKSSQGDGAPIEKVPNPIQDNTASKYESIYKNLADKTATKELGIAKDAITQNRVNTVGTASQVFKDPILRFRASTLASTKANEAMINATMASEKTRFAYLNSAERAGLSQRSYNRRIWSDLMAKRAREQDLYEKRQLAWGSTVGSGIHNIAGGLDDIKLPEGKGGDGNDLTGDLATDGIDVGDYDAYGND